MTILDPASIRRLADMHAVYRMFDEAGRLLYIGRSGRAGGRFDDHAIKRWFPLVSLITLEWHATHAEAVLAERRAIAAEKPRYNIAGASKQPVRPVRSERPQPEPPLVDALADVLEIFKNDKGLHWQVVADRLAKRFPHRWGGVSRDAVAAHCRALGVPSAKVRFPTTKEGKPLAGCRRTDVEQALAQQLLKRAV